MKKVLTILLLPILAINLVVALLLVCCAYSPMLPAEKMPLLSLAGLAFPFVLVANVLFLFFWLFVYRRYLWLPIITLFACSVPIYTFFPINFNQQDTPKNSLKVLSYNILSSNILSIKVDKDNPVINYLEEADADIICLQEVYFSFLKKHKNLLTQYPYKSYLVSKENDEAANCLACLSKYPILSVDKLKFKGTTNGCSKYRILYEGDTIVVYNCHLQSNGMDHEDKSTYEQILSNPKNNIRSKDTKELMQKLRDSAAKRASQADIIAADLKKETSPYIIVCGDFNDSPISYTCKQLREQLTDAFVNSGNGPGISYNRHRLYYRIDHILHSTQFKSYDCTVDRSIKVSDHYPIFCFLKKK